MLETTKVLVLSLARKQNFFLIAKYLLSFTHDFMGFVFSLSNVK